VTTHVLSEYETRRLPWSAPGPADRRLGEAVEVGGRRLRIRWLTGDQAEITTYSWIGVVRFEHHEVHIVPKLCDGNIGVLRMLDYASGLDALREIAAVRTLSEAGTHLRDLICLLLARTSEEILRRGPMRDYVTREDALPAVRGRLLGDRQLLRRFGQLDQLECRYDEYETDTLDNRILAAGLDLAARTASAPEVRAHARRAAADFAALCDPTGLDPAVAGTQLHYTRQNAHYRQAHHWSLLLLRGRAVRDLYASGGGRTSVFLLDMNRLFEDFVTRLVRDAMAGTDVLVRPQARDRSVLVNEATGRPHGTVIPDILLTRDARRLVADAKYKLYDERNLDSSDLFQAFLYAHALSRAGEHPNLPTAVVIHPGETQLRHRILIRDAEGRPAARVRTLGLDMRAILPALDDPPSRAELHRMLRAQLTP
jgi:5-methylcytosine-specific restriction enzyme subunit McrC